MNTIIINNTELTINYANAMSSGYGYKKISVNLINSEGNHKEFSATTSHMPGYDAASELEGDDKYKALYELVEYQLEDQIVEWINESND